MGKVIYISLEGVTPGQHVPGERRYIRCHQAMSGLWSSRHDPWSFDYVEGPRTAGDEEHVRVVLHTDKGDILYSDQRLFGRIELVGYTDLRQPGRRTYSNNRREYVKSERGTYNEINCTDFYILCRTYGCAPIKEFLCDQDEVPGAGNIYSVEALYHARIHPLTPTNLLSYSLTSRLLRNLKYDMRHAMERNLDYSWLRVYRNTDCWHCQSLIETVKIAGRTSYFCPTCQRL